MVTLLGISGQHRMRVNTMNGFFAIITKTTQLCGDMIVSAARTVKSHQTETGVASEGRNAQ